MEINKPTSDYLIALIKASIQGSTVPEKPDNVNWLDVFNLASYHKIEIITENAVKQLKVKPDESLYQKWQENAETQQLIYMIQEGEADAILKAACDSKIDILPLKGYIMRQYYPDRQWRQMGDLDYLVSTENVERMNPILVELGYSPDDVGLEDSHDVYTKLPYMEVEVHRRLFPPTEENHWYTDDIFERLLDDNVPHIKKMRLEDLYLYHLLHFEKHYSMEGAGIRPIIDQYYLMKNIGDQLDWDYINEMLPKMNYVEFEKMCRDLAEAWFGNGEMTEDLEGPAEYIINSGVFGTFEQYQRWSYERYKREQGIKSKKGYFFRRMFMERERMEFIYPSLKKHGWLLPFLWVHRLFKSVLFNRERVKKELKNFGEKDKWD